MVAYMLGIHNFYKGEDKALDDIVKTIYTIEHNELHEDGTPKDWKTGVNYCTTNL